MKHLSIGEHKVVINYKKMKTLRLAFNSLTGEIKVSAPLGVNEERIKLFLQSKLTWIDKQDSRFKAKRIKPAREYISGELLYLAGKAYQLMVIENSPINRIRIVGEDVIELKVTAGTSIQQREAFVLAWYRATLAARVAPMIESWQGRLQVQVNKWGIKKMKTRWGSCNVKTCSIWLNLELAKRSSALLEYVVVHELAHLLEPSHNMAFKAIMTKHIPDWETRKAELNGKANFLLT